MGGEERHVKNDNEREREGSLPREIREERNEMKFFFLGGVYFTSRVR